MEVTVTKINTADIADLYTSRARTSRTPGWHVSTLVRSGWHLLGGNKPYSYGDTDDLGLAAAGSVWEGLLRSYVGSLPNIGYVTDVEASKDDIYGNLDGYTVDITTGEITVQEVKFKFTALKPMSEYPLELYQVMAYCSMVGATKAVMFYGCITSRPPSFMVERRDLSFTQEEVDEAWKFLLAVRKSLEKKGIAPS